MVSFTTLSNFTLIFILIKYIFLVFIQNTSYSKMPVNRIPDGSENIPPCCFVKNSVVVPEGDPIEGMQLTRACEEVVGEGNIYGMQRLGDLWRIYCTTPKARNKLLAVGIEVRDHHVDIMSQNPYHFQGKGPSTKLIIGGVPLSVANSEIRLGLQNIGVEVKTADIRYETYRDENNKWSKVKTGRRFIFTETPKTNLDTHFTVGIWRASLWYRGQLRPKQGVIKRDPVTHDERPSMLPTNMSKKDMLWAGDVKNCLPNESSTTPHCATVGLNGNHNDDTKLSDSAELSQGESSTKSGDNGPTKKALFADALNENADQLDQNNYWFEFGDLDFLET